MFVIIGFDEADGAKEFRTWVAGTETEKLNDRLVCFYYDLASFYQAPPKEVSLLVYYQDTKNKGTELNNDNRAKNHAKNQTEKKIEIEEQCRRLNIQLDGGAYFLQGEREDLFGYIAAHLQFIEKNRILKNNYEYLKFRLEDIEYLLEKEVGLLEQKNIELRKDYLKQNREKIHKIGDSEIFLDYRVGLSAGSEFIRLYEKKYFFRVFGYSTNSYYLSSQILKLLEEISDSEMCDRQVLELDKNLESIVEKFYEKKEMDQTDLNMQSYFFLDVDLVKNQISLVTRGEFDFWLADGSKVSKISATENENEFSFKENQSLFILSPGVKRNLGDLYNEDRVLKILSQEKMDHMTKLSEILFEVGRFQNNGEESGADDFLVSDCFLGSMKVAAGKGLKVLS